jgi:hypothetical protein
MTSAGPPALAGSHVRLRAPRDACKPLHFRQSRLKRNKTSTNELCVNFVFNAK